LGRAELTLNDSLPTHEPDNSTAARRGKKRTAHGPALHGLILSADTAIVFEGRLGYLLFSVSLNQVAAPQLENADASRLDYGRSNIDVTAILAYMFKQPQPQGFIR
jgi:hypothetical protein